MVAWGLIMTLMGIVQSYHGLLVARLLLGMAEAGLFPGVAYCITLWYCREEVQLRQALFFSAASIAGAFSGILAFGIAKMDGVGGLEGWRWMCVFRLTWKDRNEANLTNRFILEGIATLVVAVVAFFVLHDFPAATASFLTVEERAWVLHRLKYQGSKDSGYMVEETESLRWKHVKEAFADWQVWAGVFVSSPQSGLESY